MKRHLKFTQSIYVKIPFLYLAILVIAFQFIAVLFIGRLEAQSVTQFKEQLANQVELVESSARAILSDDSVAENIRQDRLQQTLHTFNTTNRTYLRVINAEEYVIATNYAYQQSAVGTKTNEPEIRNVLVNQRSFVNETYDPQSKQHIYRIIRPMMKLEGDELIGVIVVEADMNSVYSLTSSITELFLQSALVAVAFSLIIAIILSQSITQPIERIRQQAIRISEGNYNEPIEVQGEDEISELALTVNELADKVKEAQEATEADRQRLDGVLRHMTDGVIATDRHGSVILVNNRALYLLREDRDLVLGQSILRLLGLDKEFRLADLLIGDKEVLLHRDDEDGTILKGEFSLVRRETGFINGLVCVLTDVTEQEKTEQERRDFVSNVSHELRTPLTSLKSYAEALLDGAWKNEEIAPNFIGVIHSEAERMYRMVDNLLNLSKIQDGKIMLQLEYIDFKKFVQSILTRYRFLLANDERYIKQGISIEAEFTSREIFVDIDTDWMTQVIDNILNNAIKYSPDGGVIQVKVVETHEKIVMSVKDQGIGIPQKDIPYLFERFYRVDKARSRDQGGTGLGLAISKEVLELHKGLIGVESQEGEGSTFFLELPYDPQEFLDYSWSDDWEEFE